MNRLIHEVFDGNFLKFFIDFKLLLFERNPGLKKFLQPFDFIFDISFNDVQPQQVCVSFVEARIVLFDQGQLLQRFSFFVAFVLEFLKRKKKIGYVLYPHNIFNQNVGVWEEMAELSV